MSHIVQLKLEIRYPDVIKAIAEQEGWPIQENETARFFGNQHVTGLAVYLPGWRYPVVISDEGTLHYDNYDGAWGAQAYLDRLVQQYVAALVYAEAQATGYHDVNEQQLEDGTLVLRLRLPQ